MKTLSLRGSLLLAFAVSACAGPGMLREDAHLIEKKLVRAKERGAYKCAPVQLATAQAEWEFLVYELSAGDYRRAKQHRDVALANVTDAVSIADPELCVEKPKPKDTDSDGVVDELDQCVDEPEDLDGFEDEDGCPDPDNDADTVLDAEDKCPLEPGVSSNGGCPLSDRDGDGVSDSVDACPDIPEDLDGNEDADGCPEEENLDSDGDGILDAIDVCLYDPEDFDQFEDTDGCPDPDNDNDTVLDATDLCPLQPGPPGNNGCPVSDRDGDGFTDDVDNCPDVPGGVPNGCPQRVLVVKTDTKIEIKKQILFQSSRAKIKGQISDEILDQITSVLRSNPEIRVMIEGHTDSVGPADYNLKLSDARANAVRDSLIERGVDPARLEAIGYGESKPIDSNRTRSGRAANRRVDFNIIQDSGDSGE